VAEVRTKAEGATAGNITVNATSLTQAGRVSAQGKAATANGGQITLVGQDITLASGSTTSAKGGANGGQINVWSSLQTTIAGTLNATGGVNGGNGGSIETSSVGTLNILGSTTVNVSAPMGIKGNWLLDPDDMVMDAATATVITSALANANVTIAVSGNFLTSAI